MNRKYKLTVLAIVALAVISVLLISNQVIFSPSEEDQAGIIDAEFTPTADPYAAYLEARQAEKPIVLEFYARW